MLLASFVTTAGADFAPAQTDPQSDSVAIVYSANPQYRRAAAVIEATLAAQRFQVLSIELPSAADSARMAAAMATLEEFKPSVVATGGVTATNLALVECPEAQVVYFMIPNALDAPFLADDSPYRSRVAGVTSDIAPDAQVDWIRSLAPSVRHLTLLASDRTQRTARALHEAGSKRGLTLDVLAANRSEFPATIDALNASDGDGVLMIPDANIYNSNTVQRLLVWGARKHKCVWAFAENIVRAGALGGLFVDAESVGEQASGVVNRVLNGERAASIGMQYPAEIRRAVNERTAKVIDVAIDDALRGPNVVRFPNK